MAAQGGEGGQIEHPDLVPAARVRVMVDAPRTGYIRAIEAEQIGLTSMRLGAGRFKKGEPIDHRTGFILQAKIGDYRKAGDQLIEIHARSQSEAASVRDALLACYSESDGPGSTPPLLLDTTSPL